MQYLQDQHQKNLLMKTKFKEGLKFKNEFYDKVIKEKEARFEVEQQEFLDQKRLDCQKEIVFEATKLFKKD